ncbi:MAG: nickel pincer cofactor biosynthesis protein LarB [Candidatus Omnitrophota bacterium]
MADDYFLKDLLRKYKKGKIDLNKVLAQLKHLPYVDMQFAKLDSHRMLRKGFPEVVYCPGKTLKQIIEIAKKILLYSKILVLTRAKEEVFSAIREIEPQVKFNQPGRIVYVDKRIKVRKKGLILVITAGTSDIPVAEEAAVISELMSNRVSRLYDVGVAGIHRLLDKNKLLAKAKVIIVVAGMEGALASVVAGLVAPPVIAVPTSVGYGANFGGVAPLLTMLNTCANGVAVVNIDNGFGAGYFASLINK